VQSQILRDVDTRSILKSIKKYLALFSPHIITVANFGGVKCMQFYHAAALKIDISIISHVTVETSVRYFFNGL